MYTVDKRGGVFRVGSWRACAVTTIPVTADLSAAQLRCYKLSHLALMALPGFAAHLRLQRTRFAPVCYSINSVGWLLVHNYVSLFMAPDLLLSIWNAVMAFSYLSELDDHTEDWMIKVRVCRKWESVNMKDGNLISLDMILIDEKVSSLPKN